MKPSARLSSAVFRLTPTRTRCDLIIITNYQKEKIASGLLNPFLAHLKTAQDQVDEGGYSIVLKPEHGSDSSWFTKATLERFVRFVSTPEILERIYIIETEISQIEEAIEMQSSNNPVKTIVESNQGKHVGGYEGDESMPSANEDKSIVLYAPGSPFSEATGSCLQEGDSKVQLLKALENRKTVLQKEQGMAFARAVAAGFDIDHMVDLLSFAKCFGAVRLMEACLRFKDLWNRKLEAGLWLNIDKSEALASQPNFSASDIIVSAIANNHDEYNSQLPSGTNEKPGSTSSAVPAINLVPDGQQEHIQGQFHPFMFPLWPMHAPPGTQPIHQMYNVHGVPYYQTCTGNRPLFHTQHHPMEQLPSNVLPLPGKNTDVRDSSTMPETRETNKTLSLDDMEMMGEVSRIQKLQKEAGGSIKKQSGMVVIRNINYIKIDEKKSDNDSNSDSRLDAKSECFEGDGCDVIPQNKKGYSQNGEHHLKSIEKLNFNNDISIIGECSNDRQWQAFQGCLLKESDNNPDAKDTGKYAMERNGKVKRHSLSDNPYSVGVRDTGVMQDGRMIYIGKISESMDRHPEGSSDGLSISRAVNDIRKSSDHSNIQFAETNGRKILISTTHEDTMFVSQHNNANFRRSSDPHDVNSFDGVANKVERDSSLELVEETFIMPFRSMSVDQAQKTAIDIESEIQSEYQKAEIEGNKDKDNYVPNDLNLMPERTDDWNLVGHYLALDNELLACAEKSEDSMRKNVSDVKGHGLKKSDKGRRSNDSSDSLHRHITGSPMRKGKPPKMSPPADARARAERLRAYKADLQKVKKEKEDAEARRLENLKLERQKRIAARAGSTPVKLSSPSPQIEQPPAKFSPTTKPGSMVIVLEPGSSSSLQRSKVKTSHAASELRKPSDTGKSEVSHLARHRSTGTMALLPEAKRESDGIKSNSWTSLPKTRRQSEPKAVSTYPVTTMTAKSVESEIKDKLSAVPSRKKASAIAKPDKNKAASPPNSKIKTSKLNLNTDQNRSVNDSQKPKETECSVSPNPDNPSTVNLIGADDNPRVGKSAVVLECEKPFLPATHSSEDRSPVLNLQHNDCHEAEASNFRSSSDSIPALPILTDEAAIEARAAQLQMQSDHNEVRAAQSGKDSSNVAIVTTGGNTFQAPHARLSSMEHPCTLLSQYDVAPLVDSELVSIVEDTVRPHVTVNALKVDSNQETSEKASVDGPLKALRHRLFNFGKKNRSSSVDQGTHLKGTGDNGVDFSNNAGNVTSTREDDSRNNHISEGETTTAGNAAQKSPFHSFLLSSFRSKTGERKYASQT